MRMSSVPSPSLDLTLDYHASGFTGTNTYTWYELHSARPVAHYVYYTASICHIDQERLAATSACDLVNTTPDAACMHLIFYG